MLLFIHYLAHFNSIFRVLALVCMVTWHHGGNIQVLFMDFLTLINCTFYCRKFKTLWPNKMYSRKIYNEQCFRSTVVLLALLQPLISVLLSFCGTLFLNQPFFWSALEKKLCMYLYSYMYVCMYVYMYTCICNSPQ